MIFDYSAKPEVFDKPVFLILHIDIGIPTLPR